MWATYGDTAVEAIPSDRDEAFVDLASFQGFVQQAKDAGHIVAIATFGRRDVADKAMRFAIGNDHAMRISTPADHPDPRHWPKPAEQAPAAVPRCPEGSALLGDKNTQLKALAAHFNAQLCDVILVDDDLNNVRKARAIGMQAVHSPDGMTRGLCDQIHASILPPKMISSRSTGRKSKK